MPGAGLVRHRKEIPALEVLYLAVAAAAKGIRREAIILEATVEMEVLAELAGPAERAEVLSIVRPRRSARMQVAAQSHAQGKLAEPGLMV